MVKARVHSIETFGAGSVTMPTHGTPTAQTFAVRMNFWHRRSATATTGGKTAGLP